MWDIAVDNWNDIYGWVGVLEIVSLTIDEPKLNGNLIRNASINVGTNISEAVGSEKDDVVRSS